MAHGYSSCKNALILCTLNNVSVMVKGTSSGYNACRIVHVACYASLVEYIIRPAVAKHLFICVSKSFHLEKRHNDILTLMC